MISETAIRTINQRIVAALADRLASTGDSAQAAADRRRIEQLVAAGDVESVLLGRALKAIGDNHALPGPLRDDAGSAYAAWCDRDWRRPLEIGLPQQSSAPYYAPAETPADTLIDAGWRALTPQQVATLARDLGVVDGLLPVRPATAFVLVRAVPWLTGVMLVRITDPNWPDASIALYYLADSAQIRRLDGTSPPIHTMNAACGFALTEALVCDYLRFFTFFVRGEEGPFYLAECADDPFLGFLREGHSADGVALAGLPFSAHHTGYGDDGRLLCTALVCYGTGLFRADFAVGRTGKMDMLEDAPVASELPGRVHAPLAWPAAGAATD